MRVGQGIDVHAFSGDPQRPLVLGGVVIAGAQGLDGHSDADVATHAVIDALLGAADQGDIGRHFSSNDPAHQNISSLKLLESTMGILANAGVIATSVDLTLVAQVPRLESHLPTMASILTEKVGCLVTCKATTTDHLGFIGREEGIAALAIAVVEQQ